jgi:aminoglycoside phosphotransferase (APT) family kinase protein
VSRSTWCWPVTNGTGMSGADDRRVAALTSALRARLNDDTITVSDLTRLGGGSSRENWAFDLVSANGVRPMLLRRDPVTSVANTEREVEVAVLRGVLDAPFPTPVIVAADLYGGALARPWVVLERSPGAADRSVLRDRDPLELGADGRRSLAVELCDLLADVHTFDPVECKLTAAADPALAEIERWETELQRVSHEPQPELAFGAMWMREHRPAPPPLVTLVHGDFRPANVLVEHGKVSALLDWEFAHLGDPVEDVGWYCTPIYRREHFLGSEWNTQTFIARYTARSGVAVEPDRLKFWQVLAAFKLAVIAIAGVSSFLDDRGDRASGPADSIVQTLVRQVIEP